jgi:ABC-type iron transport system FetAB permease component
MESLDEMTKIGKKGFFKHVFNFDEDSKKEMLNIIQYGILALVPVIILNKLMQRYVPEADEEKSSLELVFEIIVQVIVMFLVILLIHRIITYIPTYSGEKYTDFNVTNIILAMLVIILSLQTKLGEKVSILVDRLTELWEGDTKNAKKTNTKKGNVKVSQPIANNQIAINQSLASTPISSLPPVQDESMNMNMNNTNMNSMESFEPMAANAGGSWGNPISW